MTPSLLDWVTLLNRRSMALKWAMRLNPKSRFDEYLPHAQIDKRPPGSDLFVANTKGKAHTSAALNSRYKI